MIDKGRRNVKIGMVDTQTGNLKFYDWNGITKIVLSILTFKFLLFEVAVTLEEEYFSIEEE